MRRLLLVAAGFAGPCLLAIAGWIVAPAVGLAVAGVFLLAAFLMIDDGTDGGDDERT